MQKEKKMLDAGSVPTEIIYNDAEDTGSTEGSCGVAESVCGGASAGEEKLFTQRELDDLIRERLRRERRNNDALRDAKSLIDELRERGIINAGSYADAVGELEGLLSAKNGENTAVATEEAVGEVKGDCEICDVCDEGGHIEQDLSHSEASVAETSGDADIQGELCLLLERYPQAADSGILENSAFHEFVRASGRSLCDAYGVFKALADTLSGKAGTSDREARTALSSTGFSKSSARELSDNGMSLSPTQRMLARRSGISYREYASLLSDVPSADYLKRKER